MAAACVAQPRDHAIRSRFHFASALAEYGPFNRAPSMLLFRIRSKRFVENCVPAKRSSRRAAQKKPRVAGSVPLSAVSLYTGIGGLDLGFEAAGFETRVAVELDPVACAVVRKNRPSWSTLEGDIHSIGSADIMRAAKLKPGGADILIGGPPCQPFSKSGYWASGDARRLDDPRADTLMAYLRVLRDTQPRAFLLENVQGLTFKGKSEGLDALMRGIDAINRETGSTYSVSLRVLNAADYGVPQIRERAFLVGFRDGSDFSFPAPTHANNEQATLLGLLPWLTAWDALADLDAPANEIELRMRGKWAELLPSIPEGQNYLWHTPRGGGMPLFGWRTRYWSFLLKLSKRLPSWTIQAQPGPATGPFHWKNRRLSALEMARLQSFPDDLDYEALRISDAQRLIGNAVPSLLAETIAREVATTLGSKRHSERRLLRTASATPPAQERVKRVPSTFLSLASVEHAEHPGERRGKRASVRWAA
jgi:DNA (cytosine-5)-methyltransferase 1